MTQSRHPYRHMDVDTNGANAVNLHKIMLVGNGNKTLLFDILRNSKNHFHIVAIAPTQLENTVSVIISSHRRYDKAEKHIARKNRGNRLVFIVIQ